jgi:hypothetical protein
MRRAATPIPRPALARCSAALTALATAASSCHRAAPTCFHAILHLPTPLPPQPHHACRDFRDAPRRTILAFAARGLVPTLVSFALLRRPVFLGLAPCTPLPPGRQSPSRLLPLMPSRRRTHRLPATSPASRIPAAPRLAGLPVRSTCPFPISVLCIFVSSHRDPRHLSPRFALLVPLLVALRPRHRVYLSLGSNVPILTYLRRTYNVLHHRRIHNTPRPRVTAVSSPLYPHIHSPVSRPHSPPHVTHRPMLVNRHLVSFVHL